MKEETTKDSKGKSEDKHAYYLNYVCRMMDDRCSHETYRRVQMSEAFDYYYGKHVNEDYKSLMRVFENKGEKTTPYNYINFDSISSKVNVLVGELSGRDFGIHVQADNSGAYKRKKAREERLRYLMKMNQMMMQAAQESGIAYGLNENIPRNEKELKKAMDSYRDVYESMIEEAINEFVEDEMYMYLRSKNFLNLIVCNQVHAEVKLVNGYLKYRALNPLNVLIDPYALDDYQLEASGVVVAKYMSIPDVIEEYGVEHDVLKHYMEVYRNSSNEFKGWKGKSLRHGGHTSTAFSPFLNYNESTHTYERVLVLYGEWKDTRRTALKITHDSFGRSHVHTFMDGKLKSAKLTNKEKLDDRNRLEHKDIEIKRHATIVGGCYVISAGETGNYERDPDYPERTKLSIVSYVHNYNNQQSVSVVDRLKSIQDFKNFLLTSLQKEIAKTKGNGIAIDLAYVDPMVYGAGEEAVQNILSQYASYGVFTYNSQLGGVPEPGARPFQFVEQRVQSQINETLSLVGWLDQEMNKISGLNDNRLGLAPERQLVQQGRQQLLQSNAITEGLYKGFEGFEKLLFTRIARIISMSWVHRPERYDRIAQRLDIDIPEDHKADLQNYKISLKTLPIGKDLLMNMIQASMERGGISFPDAVKLLLDNNDNFREALIKFVEKHDELQERAEQAQQQQIQAEQQGKSQAEQVRAQRELAVQDKKNEGNLAVAKENNDQQYQSSKLRVDQSDRKDAIQSTFNRTR
jgi:hypothetical protein